MKVNKNKFRRFINKKSNDGEYCRKVKLEEIQKPITILLGPNGTGKSQSLLSLKYELKSKNIKYLEYSTSKNDIVQNNVNFDPIKMLSAFRSEGERMIDSFVDWVSSRFIQALRSSEKTIFVLADEIDSGLSIDRLYQTFQQLIEVVREESKRRNLHLVLTCNSYEMYEALKSELTETIWVPTLEKIDFDSYEEFREPYLFFFDEYFKD